MNNTFTDNHISLKGIEQQFEKWRASRKHRTEAIPDHLWQAAAKLCAQYGISHISRHLRLSYTELKKHACELSPTSLHFKALDLCTLTGQWQIECSRPDGTRLQMSGSGQLFDVSNILNTFLS